MLQKNKKKILISRTLIFYHLCIPNNTMKKLFFFLSSVVIILNIAGCIFHKRISDASLSLPNKTKDTLSQHEPMPYHPASARTVDIIHTKLEVGFDWEKQYLYGKATITLKPYFRPVKEFLLDAKGFDIKEVSLFSKANVPFSNPTKTLTYRYDQNQLSILLDKEYERKDTLKIFINYVAKPNERETKSGNAISSDKGLYFINPLGKEKNKPMQIWTQGEPESSSCWFPTVDKPNERMTQEILITIDSAHKNFVTLSNGILFSSRKNPDSSRTDYWKQSLPAAPYLAMIVAGDFAVVKDKWRNIEVNYYLEPEYARYAKNIFGNTPEMLEFFSNKLGVLYPWEKFSQVVVRDYVSGAMENTTAVVHGEFMNQTNREMLDYNYEDVISHELFHHWFGDYVTCESWANLALNEGFATYGEYLWQEYKYGRDEADRLAYYSMQKYFSSSAKNPQYLVRYHYLDPDDVFDAHSYDKGGAVLHMLRKYVGDDAFFTTLKLYLNRYKISSVEAAHLRLIFEEVTGEDLQWFFDQWFFSKGHPQLVIQHHYNDSLKEYYVRIRQTQDIKIFPVFRFPLSIDIYIDGKVERKQVWVNNAIEDFSFSLPHQPDLVNVDAEKALLCTKEEKKTVQEWVFQYKHCPLFADRLDALKNCAALTSIPEAAEIVLAAMNDKSPDLRERAINTIEKLPLEYKNKAKEKLMNIAQNDEKSMVRASATEQLAANFPGDADILPLLRQSVFDSSYSVASISLSALATKDEKTAMQIAKQFESEKSMRILLAAAQVYSQYGNDGNHIFFTNLSQKVNGWDNVSFAMIYTDFLKRCSDDTVNTGIKILEGIARNESNKWLRYFGQKGIKDLAQMYADRVQEITKQIAQLKTTNDSSPELKILEQQLVQAQKQKQKLTSLYNMVIVTN